MAQRNEALNIATGICILALCHVAFAVLCYLLAYIVDAILPAQGAVYYGSGFTWVLLYAVFGIGLSQVLYAVPLWLRLNRKGLAATAKGVVIGAVITLLLNGGCFLLLFSSI